MSISSALTTLLSVAGVIAAGLAPAAPPDRPVTPVAPGWVWPLDPQPQVARPFDRPEQPWLAGHRGVDLLASPGSAIRTPAEGRVSFAGVVAGRPVLVVAHGGGLRSTFEPATATLAEGGTMPQGGVVGRVAVTPGHCVPASCLHWGVLRGEVYLDPLTLLGRQRVRLLPLE